MPNPQSQQDVDDENLINAAWDYLRSLFSQFGPNWLAGLDGLTASIYQVVS